MPGELMHQRDSLRITVSTLDPVEQSRIWLALGAQEATRTLLGALRTALLLGDTVVLDRNQILEGIFFVVTSPDRLAWHLDLPPGAPLPITVGLLNPGREVEEEPALGPWQTQHGPQWGVDPETAVQIDLNYSAVAADELRVSSPLIALMGRYLGSSTKLGDSVGSHVPSQSWGNSTPDVLPPLWDGSDTKMARQVIRQGRQAWIEAMKLGRVAVEPWVRRGIDIGTALEEERVTRPDVATVAEAIMRVEEPRGLGQGCGVRHRWVLGDDPDPCTLRHVTKRSLLVRWLDGEEVSELVPTRMPPEVAELAVAERALALRWWTRAYYAAICERDGLRMLELRNVVPERNKAEGLRDLEVAWGLRVQPPGRIQTALSRLSRRRPSEGSEIAVEGEIVQHMTHFSPGQFARVHRRPLVDIRELWVKPSNHNFYDLALTVREVAGEQTTRRERISIGFVRLCALTLLAVTFALRDAGFLPDSGALWVTLWLVLAIVAAFPWGELSSLIKLSGGELQSTLRLRQDQ